MKQVKEIPIEAILTAFESSYDGLHILDREGRTIYINEACTRIEGLSREEAMKKDIRQLVSEGIYSESVTLKVIKTKKPTTIIQTVKNGNQILATGTPIFDENGSVSSVVVNSRDITELNNLKSRLSAREMELSRLKLEQGQIEGIIAKSEKMRKVLSLALNVSQVDSTILLTGESGVGKSLIAKFIHENSGRKNGPFITVDCSSIPENLFESELFGYEKGAFTGADKGGKAGLLEMGNGGTVFLDEIGEMPLSMQPKLMRVIQNREVVPVGGQKVKKLDIRFISATNRNLLEMVEEKRFREDLYYRLNVVPIHIPPLRERKEDMIPLVKHIVCGINERYGLSKELSPEAHNMLLNYQWHGNVREMENFIERILVSNAKDKIEKGDIVQYMAPNENSEELAFDFESESYKKIIGRYETFVIKAAKEQYGSIPKAAKKLGVDATTLRRKLNRYGEDL